MLAIRRVLTGASLVLAGGLIASTAQAQLPLSSPWPHIEPKGLTLDWGYGVLYVRDHRTIDYYRQTANQQTLAIVDMKDGGVAQSFTVAVAASVRPWVGFGIDGQVHEFFTTPNHPWLQELGLSFKRRPGITVGVFAEFRPWSRQYGSRRGGFFQSGVRIGTFHDSLRRDTKAVSKDVVISGYPQLPVGWLGAGYRFALAPGVSIHALADFGLSFDLLYAGLRVGGGLQ